MVDENTNAGGKAHGGENPLWVLVPVKRIATGKSRLSTVLSERERAELICRMLEDVLHALRKARCVDRVVVVSNEPSVDEVLRAADTERCPEAHEGDLNRSLMAAAAGFPASVGRVLILPSDIPTVRAADIEMLRQEQEALRGAHGEGVILCPAEIDGGTNALLSSLPLPMALEFGEASLARHRESALRQGVGARVISRRGLARDMDRPADLHWLADFGPPCLTRAYLRRLFRTAECGTT